MKHKYQPITLPPSPQPSPFRPLPSLVEPRRRCCVPLLAFLSLSLLIALPTLFFVHQRSSPSPSTSLRPDVLEQTRPPRPADRLARLAELNAGYDPTVEGFGVGSANLAAYRRDLLLAYEGLFGSERGETAVDLVELGKHRSGPVEPLWGRTTCALDPSCQSPPGTSSSHGIPSELYMTAEEISPEPPSVASWRLENPKLDINLFSDGDIFDWIEQRFPLGSIFREFTALPINILQFDLFRLIVLFARGGLYTDADTIALKAFPEWGEGAIDLTDPDLVDPENDVRTRPPALVVGVEWSGRMETNALNPLFSRSVGVVQWTFGAEKGHPVLLDAIRRVVRNSHLAMGEEEPDNGTGPQHFDPESARMVLEWSGPAVLSDALARSVPFTRFYILLVTHPSSLSDTPEPAGESASRASGASRGPSESATSSSSPSEPSTHARRPSSKLSTGPSGKTSPRGLLRRTVSCIVRLSGLR